MSLPPRLQLSSSCFPMQPQGAWPPGGLHTPKIPGALLSSCRGAQPLPSADHVVLPSCWVPLAAAKGLLEPIQAPCVPIISLDIFTGLGEKDEGSHLLFMMIKEETRTGWGIVSGPPHSLWLLQFLEWFLLRVTLHSEKTATQRSEGSWDREGPSVSLPCFHLLLPLVLFLEQRKLYREVAEISGKTTRR